MHANEISPDHVVLEGMQPTRVEALKSTSVL